MRICFAVAWLFSLLQGSIGKTSERRQLHIINQSGSDLSVQWIHPESGETIALGAPTDGEEVRLDSFANHKFLIRTDEGANSTFTVSDEELQVIVVKEDLLLDSVIPTATPTTNEYAYSQSDGIVSLCEEKAMKMKDLLPADKVLSELTQCLTQNTAQVIEQKSEELAQERRLRLDVSHVAENYTCTDPLRQTSDPIEERKWANEGVERTVHVLHDRPGSQIHVIQNFITEEECQAITAAAAKTLHRGTVADGKGGSRLSENRKAWQAGIPHNWDVEGDLVRQYSRRIFAYTNDAVGYNLTYDGQEDLMSIQYFGNGTNDTTPDRYMPHCDGECDGLPHKHGSRVATIVAYCDVPELGGGTNFQNSNVFVKATKYAAAFFSYLDPVTMKKETGFTSHSGCPVFLGTKRIAVQWMRIGVDKENPWNSFDTNNIKRNLYTKDVTELGESPDDDKNVPEWYDEDDDVMEYEED